MQDVTVLDFSREDIRQILNTKSALFDKDNSSWLFEDGSIVQSTQADKQQTYNLKNTHTHLWKSLDLAKVPKDASDMSLKQAFEAERIYKKIGNLKEIRKIQVRIQEKFTFPCRMFSIWINWQSSRL